MLQLIVIKVNISLFKYSKRKMKWFIWNYCLLHFLYRFKCWLGLRIAFIYCGWTCCGILSCLCPENRLEPFDKAEAARRLPFLNRNVRWAIDKKCLLLGYWYYFYHVRLIQENVNARRNGTDYGHPAVHRAAFSGGGRGDGVSKYGIFERGKYYRNS